MKNIFFISILFLFSVSIFAQETIVKPEEQADNKQETVKEDFTPHGKVGATLFSNFHTFLNGENSEYAFELQRAYFGYKYQLTEAFGAQVKLDIDNEDFMLNTGKDTVSKTKIFAYFKSANFQFKKNNLEINFGLIDMYQFKYHEKQWGYRYIYKSFQDAEKFGSSADLGLNVAYNFIDQVHADFTVSNGEGYKNLQGDKFFKYALGVNVKPFKNMLIRLYGDFEPKDINDSLSAITLSGFAGYNLKEKFRVGAEFDYRINEKGTEKHNMMGLSAYATYYIVKKFNVFARFDMLGSNVLENEVDPWNIGKDGFLIIGGLEYVPVKYVNLSLNYQHGISAVEGSDSNKTIYLSTQVTF